MKTLGKRELNAAVCENPHCTAPRHERLVLDARCHPGRGLAVEYDKDTAELLLSCPLCETLVTRIRVGG